MEFIHDSQGICRAQILHSLVKNFFGWVTPDSHQVLNFKVLIFRENLLKSIKEPRFKTLLEIYEYHGLYSSNPM